MRGFIFSHFFLMSTPLPVCVQIFSGRHMLFSGPGNTTSDKHGRKRWCPCRPLPAEPKLSLGPGPGGALKDREAKRVFLVTDSFFSERGTALKLPGQRGECQEIFDQVTPDPTAELIARGTARLKAFQPDLVVALGGRQSHGRGQSHGVLLRRTHSSGRHPHHLRLRGRGDGFLPL